MQDVAPADGRISQVSFDRMEEKHPCVENPREIIIILCTPCSGWLSRANFGNPRFVA